MESGLMSTWKVSESFCLVLTLYRDNEMKNGSNSPRVKERD